jgi:hypothetical protein
MNRFLLFDVNQATWYILWFSMINYLFLILKTPLSEVFFCFERKNTLKNESSFKFSLQKKSRHINQNRIQIIIFLVKIKKREGGAWYKHKLISIFNALKVDPRTYIYMYLCTSIFIFNFILKLFRTKKGAYTSHQHIYIYIYI